MQQGINTDTLFYGDNLAIMREEAVSAGFYHSPGWNKDYPRIQLLTIEELLHRAEIKMPPQHGTFKEAQQVRMQEPVHPQLELG